MSASFTTALPFQSTLPARGATQNGFGCRYLAQFQSTLPARGATPFPSSSMFRTIQFQSTLPARGATDKWTLGDKPAKFQSTLPARGATRETGQQACHRTFQSTLPARGATDDPRGCAGPDPHFNPRSPRGERLGKPRVSIKAKFISIHAPREGSDCSVPVRL